MEEKELLFNGTSVFINKTHRFGTDAMLLSHFSNIRRNEAVCDLGTGCGIMPLRFFDGGHKGRCIGVDISREAIGLFNKSIKENNAGNITAVCADLKKLCVDGLFDAVTCNPPYFTGGFKSQDNQRRVARFEEECTLNDVCTAAARLLKDGGRLCICHRPSRLADIFYCMKINKIEPKVLRLVKQKADGLPWLCLVQGQKNRGVGLKAMPDLIIENENGEKSDELLQIYKGKGLGK